MSVRWALFLSGRGSTAQALLDQLEILDIRCVISSKRRAFGGLRARRAGVPVQFFSLQSSFPELTQELKKQRINAIFLVGFMRLLPADFVQEWAGKIWNVHPSLLPAYRGANALQASFADQSRMGITIHEVTAEMDAGPLLLQAEVDRSGSWEQTQLRMSRMEQRLLREAAERFERQRGCT